MPANTSPIFSSGGSASWSSVMTASNPGHVSGTTSYLVFTAGSNGSYVSKIRFRHLPLSNNSNATRASVWINNGSAVGTASNSTLFDEITIAANTVNNAAASVNYELPLNLALPSGYTIYVTLGTAPSVGSAIQATVVGGNY